MRKVVLALSLLAFFTLPVVAVLADAPLKPGEKRLLSKVPTETEIKEITKTGVVLTFGRKGMVIISAGGALLLTWEELAAYRYMAEKMESGRAM